MKVFSVVTIFSTILWMGWLGMCQDVSVPDLEISTPLHTTTLPLTTTVTETSSESDLSERETENPLIENRPQIYSKTCDYFISRKLILIFAIKIYFELKNYSPCQVAEDRVISAAEFHILQQSDAAEQENRSVHTNTVINIFTDK